MIDKNMLDNYINLLDENIIDISSEINEFFLLTSEVTDFLINKSNRNNLNKIEISEYEKLKIEKMFMLLNNINIKMAIQSISILTPLYSTIGDISKAIDINRQKINLIKNFSINKDIVIQENNKYFINLNEFNDDNRINDDDYRIYDENNDSEFNRFMPLINNIDIMNFNNINQILHEISLIIQLVAENKINGKIFLNNSPAGLKIINKIKNELKRFQKYKENFKNISLYEHNEIIEKINKIKIKENFNIILSPYIDDNKSVETIIKSTNTIINKINRVLDVTSIVFNNKKLNERVVITTKNCKLNANAVISFNTESDNELISLKIDESISFLKRALIHELSHQRDNVLFKNLITSVNKIITEEYSLMSKKFKKSNTMFMSEYFFEELILSNNKYHSFKKYEDFFKNEKILKLFEKSKKLFNLNYFMVEDIDEKSISCKENYLTNIENICFNISSNLIDDYIGCLPEEANIIFKNNDSAKKLLINIYKDFLENSVVPYILVNHFKITEEKNISKNVLNNIKNININKKIFNKKNLSFNNSNAIYLFKNDVDRVHQELIHYTMIFFNYSGGEKNLDNILEQLPNIKIKSFDNLFNYISTLSNNNEFIENIEKNDLPTHIVLCEKNDEKFITPVSLLNLTQDINNLFNLYIDEVNEYNFYDYLTNPTELMARNLENFYLTKKNINNNFIKKSISVIAESIKSLNIGNKKKLENSIFSVKEETYLSNKIELKRIDALINEIDLDLSYLLSNKDIIDKEIKNYIKNNEDEKDCLINFGNYKIHEKKYMDEIAYETEKIVRSMKGNLKTKSPFNN